MNRIVLFAAALLAFAPIAAHSQIVAPSYQGSDGQTKEAIGTFPVSGGAPRPTGASSDMVQGTAANGAVPVGNPLPVAGSDGTNVRTLRTDASGIISVNVNSSNTSGSTANGATDAGNPVKIGGYASGTAPTAVSTGQRVNAWFSLNGAQVMGGGAQIADGISQTIGVGIPDGNGVSRAISSAGMVLGSGALTYQREARFADATAGPGLLGAGILGQYQTTLPTYTAGQFGTLAMTARGLLSVSLSSPDGALAAGVSTPADAQTQAPGLIVRSQPQFWNGTNWDRVRGDTTGGLYTQERERSQYFSEAPGILAAGGVFTGPQRDGGVSPSQWGTFSCFFRSDQASASGGAGLQGSNDGVSWVTFQNATLAATVSVRFTERNDMRYHRCALTNGATANTAAPIINSSFGN